MAGFKLLGLSSQIVGCGCFLWPESTLRQPDKSEIALNHVADRRDSTGSKRAARIDG